MSVFYQKYPVLLECTHAVLYDCSADAEGLMIACWRGFIKLENSSFLADMDACFRCFREQKVVAMVSDHAELGVITDDVMTWIHDIWYPTMVEIGLELEACMDATNPTASLSVHRMLDEKKTGGLYTPKFESFLEAYLFAKRFLKKHHAKP